MSRAKGRTGVWRVAALLAGALTQLTAGPALAQRPGVTPAGTAARPAGQDTRPEQKKLAVGKLAQARAMLTQGDLDGAESAAGEAARMNVVWSAKEDSPAKLLGEVKASRTDPKALLGASRAALARKDYARAESYAKLADRHAGLLSFPPWGDSPKQALKDIKAAQVAKAPTPGNATAAKKDTAPWNKKAAPAKADAVVQTSFNTPAKGTQPPATPAKTTAQAAKPATPPAAPQAAKPGDETDETKQVLKQAREALARKDYERAHSLVAVARQMKHKLGWYDDTPDKVEGDIRRAEGNSRRPGYPAKANAPVQTAKAATPPAATKGAANKPAVVPASATKPGVTTAVGVPKTKDEAKAQLSLGRRQLDEGKLDEAAQTAQRIKSQSHLTWGLFEDSPDRLSMDLQKARAARDKAESVRVLAEGRMLYQKGDYDGATRAAYRAQKLHGSYSIWDLGDRPTKLLADVQTAQAKARKPALPPATAVVKAETKAEPASRGGLFSRLTTTPSEPSKTTKPVEVTKTTTVVKTTPAKPVEAPVVKTAPPAESPHRLKAQQLVAEAQRLHREDKLVEARLKVVEAQQLNVRFGPDETSPEFVYQQLAIQARQKMDALTRASHDAVAQARPAVAVAKLEEAKALATSFGQDVRPIEAMLTAARGMQSATGVAQATPAAPPAVVTQASQPPAPVPVPTATPQGTKLLEDARVELRKGETANARRMAEAALTGNHNVKDEAMALLRSIDAEEFNQKQRAACRAFDAAQSAFNRREFARASAMVGAIDVKLLDADRQGRLREMSMTPEMTTLAKADKPAAPAAPAAQGPIRTVGDVSPPSDGLGGKPLPPTLGDGAGRALASDAADGGLLDKHKQMQKVLFEKLRQDSLEVQRDASEKFRAGQTDQAIEALQDYLARVQEEKLDPAQVSLLKRPIDSRISQFKLLKAQKDLAAGAVASRQAGIDKIQARYKAEEMKQKNVEKLMKDFNTLFKEGKYLEAESLAMRALELDPDSGVASTAVYMARRQRDVTGYEKIKHERERLNLAALNNAEREQGHRAIESGVDYDEERWKTARNRKATDPVKIGKPSEKEKLIERQLSTPITVSFDSTPLRSVLDELRDYHGINIVADLPAMQEAGVNLESPISIKLDKVSLKSALNLILHQVRLTHVIKDEVLMVTTEDNAKGKLSTVSYSVADLVIPVENFGDVRNGSMPAQANQAANQQSQVNGAMPFTGPWSITNGQPAGTPSGGSMLNGGGAAPAGPSGGNMNSSRRASTTTEEQLIKLITSTIQPRSWSEMGGPGTLEFFPLTLSLVINQTPDIQEQIQDLLASLRRLQDQEVSVEVRFISVSEDFFERVGVNFNMQIPTNNKRYEPLLQTGAFVPDNTQFINAFRPGRFLAGMTPAGTLTPTLDIPITQNSFFQTVPQFGNYTSSGLTMGLAFLSDIQVFLFLEAAQGDQRANVMQAPKLTLFNGQTATLNVFDQQSFVSGVQIAQVQGTGQFALVPQNNPQFNGIFLTIQAVISADRRFVRLTMAPTMTNLLPGPIYTFPVVVPIFTSIEGNQAGAPVLFTQLLQQPVQTNISIQTTVAVPDGGTVLMGGLKRLSEARSEYGPPILSKLPYINRLFKNVGYGRETDSMLIMVTPRIIVQAEEEERQTGFSSRDAGGSIGP